MDNLEKVIYDKLIEKMEIDESTIDGFTYDSPIFSSSASPDEISMGLDSVDALELFVLIYDEWEIDAPSEDISKLTSVNAIADYVRKFKEN